MYAFYTIALKYLETVQKVQSSDSYISDGFRIKKKKKTLFTETWR